MRLHAAVLALAAGAAVSVGGSSFSTPAFVSRPTAAAAAASVLSASAPALAADDDDDAAASTTSATSTTSGATTGVESIAERASRLAREREVSELETERRRSEIKARMDSDTRSIYDFALPVSGEPIPVAELVGQKWTSVSDGDEEYGGVGARREGSVKAILVVNIKQDDPIARKNIPELMALVSRFGRNGELAVVCCPTDQGYYEPDTSALIRLKLKSEYGYGINPATIITDKVQLLGTGSHPLWRWIQGKARTPAGLGRVEGNFEKFLVDARTGLPVRRYPRKYSPYEMREDVEAVVKGRALPPVTPEWKEGWRQATKDAEADTYRFQKGLNVFDQ
uniref:Glutathione peroxidase n=2 Tax=Trieres chinensis TaxID=1514140 RepID=A0A7S1ZVN5_TRICV|mmetsp:Transcript_34279/g.70005  ORF Transcript_34279/g.70005 Transcript_34279/m.70005 type:complete len:338 (+) Transcript_34279:301-1314(+)